MIQFDLLKKTTRLSFVINHDLKRIIFSKTQDCVTPRITGLGCFNVHHMFYLKGQNKPYSHTDAQKEDSSLGSRQHTLNGWAGDIWLENPVRQLGVVRSSVKPTTLTQLALSTRSNGGSYRVGGFQQERGIVQWINIIGSKWINIIGGKKQG